eukprot:COSAG02_NODE_51543_length_313_cov_0.971963_1_plen_103_part_11
MKEKLAYVATDFVDELDKLQNGDITASTYHFGSDFVTINDQAFRCPEALFQPSLLKTQGRHGMYTDAGIHELVYNAIMNCKADIRKELFSTIILTAREGTKTF